MSLTECHTAVTHAVDRKNQNLIVHRLWCSTIYTSDIKVWHVESKMKKQIKMLYLQIQYI